MPLLHVRPYTFFTSSTLCLFYMFDLMPFLQVRLYACFTFRVYAFLFMPCLQARPYASFTSSILGLFHNFDLIFLQVRAYASFLYVRSYACLQVRHYMFLMFDLMPVLQVRPYTCSTPFYKIDHMPGLQVLPFWQLWPSSSFTSSTLCLFYKFDFMPFLNVRP